MKSSRSQSRLQLLTDWNSQFHPPRSGSASKTKPPSTCTNALPKSPLNFNTQPQTCKNHQSKSFKSPDPPATAQTRIVKSRSNSNLSQAKENEGVATEHRRQELDGLCFQKIMSQLKRFMVEERCNWDLDRLNYHQLIRILHRLKYIPHATEGAHMESGEQEKLKKVYCLWLSISVKRMFSLMNLLEILGIIEKMNIESSKLESAVSQLKKELSQLNDLQECDEKIDPDFVFFMKKLQLDRQGEHLKLDSGQKSLVCHKFDSFRLDRLKDATPLSCSKVVESEVIDNPQVSKKSADMANSKRSKMTASIKSRKPHIENIDLFDLLNYRERDFVDRTPKSNNNEVVNKFSKRKRSGKDMKKEIEELAKPKMSGQDFTADELKYQRNRDDYTFNPKIHPLRSNSQERKKIPNLEKTVFRMKEARELKQQQENLINKGWTPSQAQLRDMKRKQPKRAPLAQIEQVDEGRVEPQSTVEAEPKMKKYEVSKDYLRIPILYIDVNIEEGRKERIVIYDNDTASGLAKEFTLKHGLSQETMQRLESLLQQQMDTVLARIEEQTEEDCSIIF